MLQWLRDRSRHRKQGRHAIDDRVARNAQDIADLRAQMRFLAAEPGRRPLPPPPPELTAAASIYTPRGRAVFTADNDGRPCVLTGDFAGDPEAWWEYINSSGQWHGAA